MLEGDSIRIIDYKTGADTINPEYFRKGYKLQLMVYLKAALDLSLIHILRTNTTSKDISLDSL